VDLGTAVALPLALVSTTLTNLAYLREHDAAASLPVLCMRRPLHSAHLLLSDRSWLLGFAMESVGFLLYALALFLSSLALVQSVGAGGIGILAFVTSRLGRRRLARRERIGAGLAVVGLLFLGLSLIGGGGSSGNGSIVLLALWIGASAAAGVAVLGLGRRVRGRAVLDPAVAAGIAGGLFFSIGDISTKAATDGGIRIAFVVTLVVGYTAGTALLQVGYQAGGTLTVAGLATLLTNALPIAAGTAILGEDLPGGVYGGLRAAAFAAVSVGAFLLARPEKKASQRAPDDAGSGRPLLADDAVAPEDEEAELIHAESLPRAGHQRKS
jgi:drug/metabolite transporter (DMT)-like permease